MFHNYVIVDVNTPAGMPARKVRKEIREITQFGGIDRNIAMQPYIVIAKCPQAACIFRSIANLI